MTSRAPLLFTFALASSAVGMAGGLPAGPHGGGTNVQKVAVAGAFESFKARFMEAWWAQNPEAGVGVGYYRHADQVSLPGPAGRRAAVAFADTWLKRLRAFPEKSLSPAERIDHVLMREQLEGMRWSLTQFKSHEWNPSEYNVADTFGLILGTEYAPLETRLRTVAKRLAKVPAYYAAARASLKTPTREHTDLAILQNKGALGLFGESFLAKVEGSSLPVGEKAGLKAGAARAQKAIQGYIDHLTALEAANKVGRSFRIGKAAFEKQFTYAIQMDGSAEQLYQRALAEKETLHARMDQMTQKIWPTYFGTEPMPGDRLDRIGRMVAKLSEKHVAADQFVAEVKRQIPLLERWVTEHRLVDLDPSKPLVVRETPEYMRGVAGASISAPGPYDPKANTYYNVTPLEGTDREKESYLREYNDYILQVLNIHEAIPGHYVQLLHANQSPSLVQSIFGNGAMIEGWAVYSERMMLESGYGGNTPEMWLMYSKWNLRVVCNTILDYSIHVLDMPREKGIELLRREAFQEETEAREKWHRAQVSSVQLSSYFAGYSAILDLREQLKTRQKEAFDLRRFHQELLSFGSAPVKLIRRAMLEKH